MKWRASVRHLRGHCLVLLSGILAGLSSLLSGSVLIIDAFYKDAPSHTKEIWLLSAAMSGAVLIGIFHTLLICGRVKWLWGIVLLLLGCFLMTLPTIEHRPAKAIYYLGTLSPLIGLVILNSNAHRTLRKSAVVMRHKRERLIVIRLARARRLK